MSTTARALRQLGRRVLLLACLCTHRVHTQPDAARISGIITLRNTGAGIASATVALEGTSFTTRTDSVGRYTFVRVPEGPQTVVARYLGYAPARVPVSVPSSGSITVNITLARSALQLDQLIVTADRTGRARGELGTATVIDRDAIANQIASSLQGVLELTPGVLLQPPGLDAAAQFSLRSLGTLGSTTNGAGGPGAADIGAAGTLIILDGIPLSNNANLQSVGNRGEIVPPASTAGGGIDLRRIPAAALERVEVIRGLPSVRWGDLTQGAIVVDTRAAAAAPEFAARFDPRTGEGNIVGGRSFGTDRQAITLTANLAQTAAAKTLSSAVTTRSAGQLAHRLNLGTAPTSHTDPRDHSSRLTLDTRADWYQLKYDSPERPDVEVGRNSFQDDHGIRLGERARLALSNGSLEVTAAYDGQSQDIRETRRLSRPTAPFTDKLTEGRAIGRYIEGTYIGAYELRGAPRLLYSRVEYVRDGAPQAATGVGQFRVGGELRREWNNGTGYDFAIDRPPQASTFNGVRGYDRPRSFQDTPPLTSSAAYADARLSAAAHGVIGEVQPGVRVDVLHDGSWWTSGAQSTLFEPRLNAQLSLKPWFRFRGAAGIVGKLPTIAQLYPAPQYFDIINVNRFPPDPRERLAVLTTFIRDPRNANLGLSRAVSREAGFEIDGGAKKGALSVTWYDDLQKNAVTIRRDASSLQRDRYALVDTQRGSGQPGRIVDPPIGADPIPIFVDRFVNGGRLGNRGVEFTLAFPVVPAIRTRLEVSGGKLQTDFSTDDRDYGSFGAVTAFTVDTAIKRIPYYQGSAQRAKRSVITWRLVHHQPDLGLVITGTLQQRLGDEQTTLVNSDSLSFEGYINRDGVLVPVALDRRTAAEFSDLRRSHVVQINSSHLPNDYIVSLQVAKSIAGSGRLSFYAFNAFDRFATLSGANIRVSPSTRFGAELTLPTSALLRR